MAYEITPFFNTHDISTVNFISNLKKLTLHSLVLQTSFLWQIPMRKLPENRENLDAPSGKVWNPKSKNLLPRKTKNRQSAKLNHHEIFMQQGMCEVGSRAQKHSGPVHTYLFSFENATFSLRIGLPSIRIRWKRWPKNTTFRRKSSPEWNSIFVFSCGQWKRNFSKTMTSQSWIQPTSRERPVKNKPKCKIAKETVLQKDREYRSTLSGMIPNRHFPRS